MSTVLICKFKNGRVCAVRELMFTICNMVFLYDVPEAQLVEHGAVTPEQGSGFDSQVHRC